MEELIINDEDFNLSESQDNQVMQETEALSVVPVKTYEEIDISSPVFTGFQVAGTMCLLSLGIHLAFRYFKIA